MTDTLQTNTVCLAPPIGIRDVIVIVCGPIRAKKGGAERSEVGSNSCPGEDEAP